MESLNDEVNRQRDESFFMKDGKEIPDSQVPNDTILGTQYAMSHIANSNPSIPTEAFYKGNNPYYGNICWNEGPCSNLSVKIWETQKKGRFGKV